MKKRMRIFSLILSVIVLFAGAHDAVAAKAKSETLSEKAGFEEVVMPELFSASILLDNDGEPPVSPIFAQVPFKRLPEVSGLEDRMDRVIQGVIMDVSPEFDHYGYEIRRYMSKIGDIEIYTDEEFLKDQIRNVRKARVIAEYWIDRINKELDTLEEEVEKASALAFSTKTEFKMNARRLKTFQIVLKSWINANEDFLMAVFNNFPEIELVYPELIVNATASSGRVDIYNALVARQTKLKEIRQYEQFIMMVY